MGKEKTSREYSFDNYTIINSLGSGAFSNVYMAKQLSTGQSVAIKVLKQESGGKADTLEKRIVRFKREMHLCAELHHVNIVKVLDFGKTHSGELFTVFEYIPGKTLGQIPKEEGALSVKRTFKIMAQILAAIASAHSTGVIHRDLKPENIMISTDGSDSVKLLDFGISTIINNDKDSVKLTLTHDFLGTPAYAAPEQVRGESISNKVDIFAWGLIFIECLTGENAYDETNKAKLVQKQLSKEPIPIPVSLRGHSLGDFLSWVLQKQPQRRAADSSEVLKRFNHLSDSSIPQNGGFLKANDKTGHELMSLRKQDYKALTRRKISALICELKLKSGEQQKNSELLDCLYHDSFELCRTVAESNGAYTASYTGGRIVLYFGYPSPGDFHARSAAKTALDLSSSLTQTQKALFVSHQAELIWKISVHTGEVTIKNTPDKNEVFGVFLGEASDLISKVPDNEVIASQRLYDRLFKSFNFHILQKVEQTYRLTGMREVQSLFSRYKNDPLHGRSSELQELEGIRLRSLQKGQAVMIQGEAGIGKSRFMAESVTTTSIERSAIYELLCYPENRNSALAPFIEFLKKYFKIGEFSSLNLCNKSILKELKHCSIDAKKYIALMYYWMGIESEEFPPLEIAPKKQKELFLEFTCQLFLEHILEDKSTLIFDDLHWADPTSLELLSMMLDKINNYSCIILMSARPEFISPWNSSLISFIDLQGLSENDVSQMIRSRLGQTNLPAKLIETIIRKVDGNPLFAEEMINSVMAEDGAAFNERDVPDTLRELFSNKLDRIGEAKLSAQLASVIGRKFNYDLLKAIHTKKEEVLLADLTQLLAAGFIHVVPRSDALEYVFHHALVCDSAYESMGPELCKKTHRKAADELKKNYIKDTDKSTEFNPLIRELAHHYYQCCDFQQALEYHILAGKQVLRLSAYREAIEYFETALLCLKELPAIKKDVEIDIRIKLGVCLKTVFGWHDQRAIKEYDRIMALCEDNENANLEELAPIIFGRWAAVMTSLKFKNALKLAMRYLKIAETSKNPEALMQAHLTVANNLYWLGDIVTSHSHVQKSLKYYKGLKSSNLIEKIGYEPVTMVYMLDVWCLWNLGKLNEAETCLHKYLDFTEKLQHPFSQAIMIHVAVWHYYHNSNVEQCALYSQKLIELSNKFSLSFYEGIGLLFYGWSIAKQGQFQEGLKNIKTANEKYINPDKGKFLNSAYSCVLAEVLLENDTVQEAKNILDEALKIALENDENCYLPEIYRLLSEVELQHSNTDKSEYYIQKSIEVSISQNMLPFELRATLDYTTIKLINGDENISGLLKPLLQKFAPTESSSDLLEARDLLNP
ncbi:MAG: protein kinase [Lentisphaeraceae bacterium]|nr:protein kinase [Lentisphaeraceae bacterium]